MLYPRVKDHLIKKNTRHENLSFEFLVKVVQENLQTL